LEERDWDLPGSPPLPAALPDFDLPLTLPDIVYWGAGSLRVCEGTEDEGQRWWGYKKDVASAIVVLLKREADSTTKQTKITRLGNHSFGIVAHRRPFHDLVVKDW
jgi:hypothetical protein